MSGNTRGSAGLEGREAAISSRLADLEQQRWMQSEAFYQRSEIRSSLRNHAGALEDANVALALFPQHTKYLIRASYASFDNGLPFEAGLLLERAKCSIDSAHGGDGTLAALDTTAALERRLKPFGRLPDELIIIIFQFVQQDWERLPSPFQLSHVCSRWKRLAESTPSLWQDLRILRVWDRAYTTDKTDFFPSVKRTYRFTQTEDTGDYICSRRDLNHLKLLRLCTERSQSSLSHLELDLWWEWEEGSEFIPDLSDIAYTSCRSLRSASFVQRNAKERLRYADPRGSAIASSFAAFSLDVVMTSPKLRDVELYVGELLQGEDDIPDYSHTAEDVAPTPSFRSLRLDCFAGFNHPKWTAARDNFLLRASQLQSLTLLNVPNVDMKVFNPNDLPFVLRLLRACAETLVDLEAVGQGNILAGAQAAGVTSFPRLRRYRHFKWDRYSHSARIRARDMDRLALPSLETVEAPASVITKLPRAPLLHIVLHLEDHKLPPSACTRFAGWLLALGDASSPHSLTILDTYARYHDEHLNDILDALTPSCAGRVACAKLQNLRLVSRPAYWPDDAGNAPSLDPAPLPPGREHQEASSVPRLARMMAERGRVAQGLPPVEGSSNDRGAVWMRCEALTIELEGWIFSEES